jgi:hypothetical protein
MGIALWQGAVSLQLDEINQLGTVRVLAPLKPCKPMLRIRK